MNSLMNDGLFAPYVQAIQSIVVRYLECLVVSVSVSTIVLRGCESRLGFTRAVHSVRRGILGLGEEKGKLKERDCWWWAVYMRESVKAWDCE